MIVRKPWQSDFQVPADLQSMTLCWTSPPATEEHDLHFISRAAFLFAWTTAIVTCGGGDCTVPEAWGNWVQPCHRSLNITETSMWNTKVIIHCMMWIISGQKYSTELLLSCETARDSYLYRTIHCLLFSAISIKEINNNILHTLQGIWCYKYRTIKPLEVDYI